MIFYSTTAGAFFQVTTWSVALRSATFVNILVWVCSTWAEIQSKDYYRCQSLTRVAGGTHYLPGTLGLSLSPHSFVRGASRFLKRRLRNYLDAGWNESFRVHMANDFVAWLHLPVTSEHQELYTSMSSPGLFLYLYGDPCSWTFVSRET